MSDINLEWLQENFKNHPCVVFNVGCADLSDDSLRFKVALPGSDIYSFDCAETWRLSNLEKSKVYDLHYEHVGISYFDGRSTFYNKKQIEHESGTNDPVERFWQYVGNFSKPSTPELESWTSQVVDVMSLNTICQQKKIKPNFLHMDVEGEEYNVLKNLKEEFWPQVIWLEYWQTYRNEEQHRVPYSVLHMLLQDRNYDLLYKQHDALYVQKGFQPTEYKAYNHGESFDPKSPYEITIQKKIWLYRYSLIRDPSWPELVEPRDYFELPQSIKRECDTMYNLEPIKAIC